MVTAAQIRQQVVAYLAQGIDLDALEDWIAQNTWNIHLAPGLDSSAIHLAHSIELRLSEHSTGHLPETELRGELSALLTTPMRVVNHVLVGESHSSNQPLQGREWRLMPLAGISSAKVLV